jgi:hypothetical protein
MKTRNLKKSKTLILVLLLAIFCPMGLLAQQLITFKSGYSCRAIVLDKSGDTLRYQPVSDPNVTLRAPMWMVESITEAGSLIPGRDKAHYETKLKSAKRFTIAGGVILSTGVIMSAVGISGMKHHDDYNYYGHGSDYKTYTIITSVSEILVVSGAVFTIIGGINVGVAKKELRKFKVEIEPNPGISGVTVRLKF